MVRVIDVDSEVNAGRKTALLHLYQLSNLFKGAVVIITIAMVIFSCQNGRVGQC